MAPFQWKLGIAPIAGIAVGLVDSAAGVNTAVGGHVAAPLGFGGGDGSVTSCEDT